LALGTAPWREIKGWEKLGTPERKQQQLNTMDHSQPQCGNGQQHHSLHSPSKKGEDIMNRDGADIMSAPDTALQDSSSPRDLDDDRDERDSPSLFNDPMMNDYNDVNNGTAAQSTQQSDNSSTSRTHQEQTSTDAIRLNTNPSLSLSTSYSGYDTEEDEDNILKRFHDQTTISSKSILMLNTSLDGDEDSVYSAVHTEEEEEDTTTPNGSSHHGKSRKNKKKKPTDVIKSAIQGMRKAHEEAKRQRSTRQFIAMTEGHRTASSFTEAICLSPYCDFSSQRGMITMMAVLILLTAVVVALIKLEHLAGGVWTFVVGIVILFVRRFWVPIYWLVWGQFVEKRRRRNMARYDTLNGGERENGSRSASGEIRMGVQNDNFEKVQDYDESEMEFVEETNDNNSTLGELA
jgi:hypothetical protein